MSSASGAHHHVQQQHAKPPPMVGSRVLPTMSQRKTVVVGGFEPDFQREVIKGVLREVSKGIGGLDGSWAPTRRGSIGKLFFKSPEKMWEWIQGRTGQKLTVGTDTFWYNGEAKGGDMARKVFMGTKISRT